MSSEPTTSEFVRTLLENYPDCPQREMALSLERRGLRDQAQAWVDALDEMKERGQSSLFESKAQGLKKA